MIVQHRPTRRTRRPRKSYTVFGLAILLLLAASVLGAEIDKQLKPVSNVPGESITIEIPQRSTTASISQDLYEKGLIRSPFFFQVYTRLKGLDGRLQAGEYQLSPQMSLTEILDRLTTGKVTTYSFTIPEGFTLKQITNRLAEKGLIDPVKFQDLLQNGNFPYRFLEGIPNRENRLEGFLFPATYKVVKGTSEEQIIDMMLKRFGQAYTEEMEQEARKRNLTTMELITIASLIEKEARVDSERPIIAGVLYNRLEKGMLLQVDATILYALGEHRERVMYEDLEVDSPYNTYKHKGLPPGPIASPGLSSIKAALEPQSHGYYYYVAKADGSHAFSRTLAEHNAAIKKYRSKS